MHRNNRALFDHLVRTSEQLQRRSGDRYGLRSVNSPLRRDRVIFAGSGTTAFVLSAPSGQKLCADYMQTIQLQISTSIVTPLGCLTGANLQPFATGRHPC
jgi:hypothetical protein